MAGRHFHPDELSAAYDFLCATPPFKGWKLPSSDDLAFEVMTKKGYHGETIYNNPGTSLIRISLAGVSHTNLLIESMAHEMTHLYQFIKKRDTRGVQHNTDFLALTNKVCRVHGWDPKGF